MYKPSWPTNARPSRLTFNLRAGMDVGSLCVNRDRNAQRMTGALVSSLSVTEVVPGVETVAGNTPVDRLVQVKHVQGTDQFTSTKFIIPGPSAPTRTEVIWGVTRGSTARSPIIVGLSPALVCSVCASCRALAVVAGGRAACCEHHAALCEQPAHPGGLGERRDDECTWGREPRTSGGLVGHASVRRSTACY